MSQYDLDYLINLAYEYYYLKNADKCYEKFDIDISDSKVMSNIKLVPPPDKVNFWINQIFNTDINFIEKFEEKYLFSRIGPVNTTVVISMYPDTESRMKIDSDYNNDQQMSFLLSDFVTKGLTKHILLPILNIDLPIKNLLPFLQKHQQTENLWTHTNEYVSISIYERFFKSMKLEKFLSKTNVENMSEEDFYNLVFQVVHTLAIIRKKYPKFNHNLLNTSSIDVYLVEKGKHLAEYVYDNTIINLKSNGVVVKLSNFYLTEVESDNSDDIKTFLNSLLNNSNVKEYLKNYLTIQKFIIEYINMKPEQIMKNHNFINQIGAGNSSNPSQLNQKINLLSDESQNLIGGQRTLFMYNKNLNHTNSHSDSQISDSENSAINLMADQLNKIDLQNGGKSKKSKSSKHSKRSLHNKEKSSDSPESDDSDDTSESSSNSNSNSKSKSKHTKSSKRASKYSKSNRSSKDKKSNKSSKDKKSSKHSKKSKRDSKSISGTTGNGISRVAQIGRAHV
jgi:hypothetical protein